MAGAAIAGVVGQIKWSYYMAAAVNGYTVVRDAETKRWSVTGLIVISDAFKLAQRPLTFVAPHEKGEWRWPIETLAIEQGALLGPFSATLGAPLE